MAKEQSAPDTKRLTRSVRGTARFMADPVSRVLFVACASSAGAGSCTRPYSAHPRLLRIPRGTRTRRSSRRRGRPPSDGARCTSERRESPSPDPRSARIPGSTSARPTASPESPRPSPFLRARQALGDRGVEGLRLQPFAQRAVRLGPDHAVELAPVTRDDARTTDLHVVGLPAPVAHAQAKVEVDHRASPGHDL